MSRTRTVNVASLAVFFLTTFGATSLHAQLVAPTGCLPTGGVSGDIPVLFDLDGDGDRDAVLFSSTGSTGEILLNDGTGQFTSGGVVVSGGIPDQASAADLEGDGDPDLFVRNTTSVTIFVNTAGVLVPQTQPVDAALGDVEPFDLDNDGDLDLWFTGGHLSLNNAGVFGAAVAFQPGTNFVQEIHVCDLGGDGDPDFYERHPNNPFMQEPRWSVWRNDGGGAFVETQADIPLTYMNHGDVDGDGEVDFVFVDTGANLALSAFEVRFGDGSGGIASIEGFGGFAEGVATGAQRRPLVADLTGDGADEVIVRRMGFLIFGGQAAFDVVVRNAPSQFGYHVGDTLPENMVAHRYATGDVDGDGFGDIVVGRGSVQPSPQACIYRVDPNFPRMVQVVSGNDQVTTFGRDLPQPLVVEVTDSMTGLPVAGVPVEFRPGAAGTSTVGLTPTMTTTDANGRAQTVVNANVAAGTHEIDVVADGANPTTTKASFFTRALTVAWNPGFGLLTIRFINDKAGIPILLAVDVPLPSPVMTVFGPIHTSVLAPGPFLAVLDGIGVFTAPDPTLVTDYIRQFSFGPTAPLGVTAVFQVYGLDASLPFPQSIFTSNPAFVAF